MATIKQDICRSCGAANRAGARFCRKCGQKLRSFADRTEAYLLGFLVITSLATVVLSIAGLVRGNEAAWYHWAYRGSGDLFLAGQLALTASLGLAGASLLRRGVSRAARIFIVACLFTACACASWLHWANTTHWADEGHYMKYDLDEMKEAERERERSAEGQQPS